MVGRDFLCARKMAGALAFFIFRAHSVAQLNILHGADSSCYSPQQGQ